MAYAHIPESEYYGDQVRWFIGTVVDINDPLKLDRVRVRVYGIHTSNTIDIPTEDLPWAKVIIPVTEGGTSGIGANSQIKIRAQVFGVFLDGKDSQLPVILGSMPKVETVRNDENESITVENEYNEGSSVDLEALPKLAPNSLRPMFQTPNKGKLKGKTNAEKAFNFFLTEEGGGFTKEQAAGIVGNFMQESGMRTTIRSGFMLADGVTPENSYGIAQWNPSKNAGYRFQRLVAFSKRAGLDYSTLYAQLKFTIWELSTFEELGLAQLRNAKTVEEATNVFMRKFENPKKEHRNLKQRINYATEIKNKMEYV